MTPAPNPGDRIRVVLFAGMAERAGSRQLDIPWSGGTVADLLAAVRSVRPALGPLLDRSAVAIGERYASPGDPVAAADEVAIIPPVSGG